MSKVDLSKIVKGDTVVVELKVLTPPVVVGVGMNVKSVFWTFNSNGAIITMDSSQIVDFKPRGPTVGDAVYIGDAGSIQTGVICMVENGEAWVKLDVNGRHATYGLDTLTRKG